ncbi:NUDIX hydrolase [Timonella senegalensis]|uniref:NUDIX hydrolase n=2 Tax=Timonella senegalensis TaxID=1465825 RepID=UPI002FDD43C9
MSSAPLKKVQGGRARGITGVGSPALESTPVIECAGALVWRVHDGALQVKLIHRPKYNDWSWPKGKVDLGETLAAAAVREVKEETGKYIVLGIALPGLQYITPEGELKRVHYWAARQVPKTEPSVVARPPVAPVNAAEVDRSEWCTVKEAAKRLSRAADKIPLTALVDAYDKGELDTHVVAIARHGKALARAQWNGPEATRPLTPLGVAQSEALVPVFAAFGISDVVSSVWARCAATTAPYVRAAGVHGSLSELFTEASHERNPKVVIAAVNQLVASSKTSLLCTHRPVLPTLFKAMAALTPNKSVRAAYPKDDPYLSPGQVVIAHVIPARAEGEAPKIVGVETIRPALH